MSEELIGKTAVVSQDIDPGEAGKVTLQRYGMVAFIFARSFSEITLRKGTKVLITDVLDPNTLNVQPL